MTNEPEGPGAHTAAAAAWAAAWLVKLQGPVNLGKLLGSGHTSVGTGDDAVLIEEHTHHRPHYRHKYATPWLSFTGDWSLTNMPLVAGVVEAWGKHYGASDADPDEVAGIVSLVLAGGAAEVGAMTVEEDDDDEAYFLEGAGHVDVVNAMLLSAVFRLWSARRMDQRMKPTTETP